MTFLNLREPSYRITTSAFFDRFTKNELRDLEMAKLDDPTAANAVRKDAANLRAWDRKLIVAGSVNLKGNRVANFLDDLVTANVITLARKDEIINTPIQDEERP